MHISRKKRYIVMYKRRTHEAATLATRFNKYIIVLLFLKVELLNELDRGDNGRQSETTQGRIIKRNRTQKGAHSLIGYSEIIDH